MTGPFTVGDAAYDTLDAAIAAARATARFGNQAHVIGRCGRLLASVVPRGEGTSTSMTLAGLEYAPKSPGTAIEQAGTVARWISARRLSMRNAVVARGEIREIVTGRGLLATIMPNTRSVVFLPGSGLGIEVEATGDDPHRLFHHLERVGANPEVQAILLVTTSRHIRPVAAGGKNVVLARPFTGRVRHAG